MTSATLSRSTLGFVNTFLATLPSLLEGTLFFALLFVLPACGSETPADDDDTDDDDSDDAPRFCSGPGSAQAAGEGAWQVEGPHYSIYAESSEAEALVMSAILEAGWDALTDWFGTSPNLVTGELLAVEFYSSEAAWEEAIAEDGLEVPFGSGGLYHPTTGTAYLYRQPTRYYTRQLLIHEVVHQFHNRARLQGHSAPGWYMEGHAEYLSLHDWDDACLRLGRLPLVSQEDLPAQALAQASELDLDGQLAGAASMSRPLAWAMFRYFDLGEGSAWTEDWTAFRDAMDGGGTDAVAEFEAAFGASPGSFDEDIVAWLGTEQQPLTPSTLEWSHVGPSAVDGWANVFTIAPLKDGASSFSVRFEPPTSGSWSGGVLLSFDDPSNWVALVAGSEGRLSTFEVGGSEAWWWDQAALPELQDGGYRFEVLHAADKSLVRVNGEELPLPLAFSPAGGLALNAASLRFTDIDWD